MTVKELRTMVEQCASGTNRIIIETSFDDFEQSLRERIKELELQEGSPTLIAINKIRIEELKARLGDGNK